MKNDKKMKTPLFFVSCTTCGARIRFFDEGRLGEIIPCPKCESMVLVEKEENEKNTKDTVIARNIPTPPALPISENSSTVENREVSENEESEEEAFRFEGETETGWSPCALMWGTAGIAGGVFLVGIALFFLLGIGEKSKNPELALKIPKIEENVTISENLEEEKVEIVENTEKSDGAPDSKKIEADGDVKVIHDEDEENIAKDEATLEDLDGFDNTDGNLSGFMQSDVGKILSEELPIKTETPTDSDKESTEERDSETKIEVKVESASVPEIVTEAEESKNPERLQFTRRKRARVYSGEDPTLNFDEATQEVVENLDENLVPKQDAEVKTESETAVNVATPDDETVKEETEEPILKTFRIKAPAVEYLSASWAEKLAIPLESVNISERPASALAQFGTQMAGERIQADWKQLERLGVSMETPVALMLEGTTLRETLDTGLYSVGLGLIPVGTGVRVAGWEASLVARTAAEKGEKIGKHILELEDLVATFESETSGKSGIGEIERMIPKFVHPALWEGYGGVGRVSVNATKKRITLLQYPSVAQEVKLFCDKIRRARNMEMKNLPTASGKRRMTLSDGTEICDTEIIPRYALSEKARWTLISCDLSDGSTLRNALTELFRCADAKIVIDEAAIARIPITAVIRDADVPDFEGNKPILPDSILDLPCVYRFDEIPLEEAVSDVLKSVPLCCYPVGRNVFFLTTVDEARRKMLVDFFQVGDVVKNPEMAGTILNGICETIYPKTWMQNGGNGAIYFDVPSRSLIVRQNPYVIYSIEMFLKQYRERQNPEAQMEGKR